ncbi:hypothetical protein [Streptomyces sirii]|uniref:hypothetical protein n=1 Tax=Streptomyces sirii TaxID=3127701 RepID=UPI003D368D16
MAFASWQSIAEFGPLGSSGTNLVGIPARNDVSTIAEVAEAADRGLLKAFPAGNNVVMLADNGSVDGTVERFAATRLQAEKLTVCSDSAGNGKGTNVLALVGKALQLGARQLVIMGVTLAIPIPSGFGCWHRRCPATDRLWLCLLMFVAGMRRAPRIS